MFSVKWVHREYTLMKPVCDKPTPNIMFSGDKLKTYPLRSGTWQGCPVSLLSFNMKVEVLATVIEQEKEIKCSKLERSKSVTMYRRHDTTYRKATKLHQKLSEL